MMDSGDSSDSVLKCKETDASFHRSCQRINRGNEIGGTPTSPNGLGIAAIVEDHEKSLHRPRVVGRGGGGGLRCIRQRKESLKH